MSVGIPQQFLLHEFGEHVHHAFGHVCYQVGSSLREKLWRDVDVRLMLPDEEYARLELGDPARPHDNQRWVSIILAWSTFGRTFTGLPIDFQIQQRSHANEKEKGPRSALLVISRAHANSQLWDRAQAAVRDEGFARPL